MNKQELKLKILAQKYVDAELLLEELDDDWDDECTSCPHYRSGSIECNHPDSPRGQITCNQIDCPLRREHHE